MIRWRSRVCHPRPPHIRHVLIRFSSPVHGDVDVGVVHGLDDATGAVAPGPGAASFLPAAPAAGCPHRPGAPEKRAFSWCPPAPRFSPGLDHQKTHAIINTRLRGCAELFYEKGRTMLLGYMRVSKSDGSQSLDLQRDALLAAGVAPERLYKDHASGRQDARPGL